jgi:hypothetical protein
MSISKAHLRKIRSKLAKVTTQFSVGMVTIASLQVMVMMRSLVALVRTLLMAVTVKIRPAMMVQALVSA